uniref:C2H2-type domain-containing protein n=1 Tax=Romanomermis culicivorax TaxID=13658 RepID=A0A915JZ99_ROMCU
LGTWKLEELERERTHICPQCNKAFFQKGHLTQHLMIHQGGRPHACHLCPKTFIFKFDLNRHMKIHAERVQSANGNNNNASNNDGNPESHFSDNGDNNDSTQEIDSTNYAFFSTADKDNHNNAEDRRRSQNSTTKAKSVTSISSKVFNNLSDLTKKTGENANKNNSSNSNGIFFNANNLMALSHLQNLHLSRVFSPLFLRRRYSHESSLVQNSENLNDCLNIFKQRYSFNECQRQSQLNGEGNSASPTCGEDANLSTVFDGIVGKDNDAVPAKTSIENGHIHEKAASSSMDDTISPRSPSSASLAECEQCTFYKNQWETSQKYVTELQHLLSQRHREIESLKSNVQHIGQMAGSLFKTCSEYETLWHHAAGSPPHDNRLLEQVQRLLNSLQ